MSYLRILSAILLLPALLAACSTPISLNFEKPVVTVCSFNVLPSSSLSPTFEIGLHIVNPNPIPLKLRGISYSASIQGQRVLAGASNDLPTIEAYGEGDVKLTASPDLFGSLKLVRSLMSKPGGSLSYNLALKLDVGSLIPAINIERSGKVGKL